MLEQTKQEADMKAKSLSGKMKLAKALGEILVKWHMANKPLIEEFLVNNPAHGIARSLSDFPLSF